MSDAPRISGPQLACISAGLVESTALLFLPAKMARDVGPSGWLVVPVTVALVGCPFALLVGAIAHMNPGQGMGDIARTCVGKWGAKGLTLVTGAYSLLVCSLVLKELVDFTEVFLLQGTPMVVTSVMLAAAMAYSAYGGAEVIARMAVVSILLKVIAIGFMALALSTEFHYLRILPVLGENVSGLMHSSWSVSGWFAEVWLCTQLASAVDRPKAVGRSLIWGVLLGGTLLTVLVVCTILVFGAELTSVITYPAYLLAQEVSVEEFLQRMEVSLVAVWMFSVVVKGSTCLWIAAAAFQHTAGLATDRKVILPLIAVAVAFGFMWPRFPDLIHFLFTWWSTITIPCGLSILLLLVLVSWARRRSAKGVQQ